MKRRDLRFASEVCFIVSALISAEALIATGNEMFFLFAVTAFVGALYVFVN